jgi:hypothetical protein
MANQFKEWSVKHIIFLRKHYPLKGTKWCAIKLDRTLNAVQVKANRMGLKSRAFESKTDEELITEASHYQDIQDIRKWNCGLYRTLHRRKINHLIFGKKPQEYTNREIVEFCSNFESRTELEAHKTKTENGNAIRIEVYRRKLTDLAFSHMRRLGNNKQRLIYAIEFEDRSAYIGLAGNYKTRLQQHLSNTPQIVEKVSLGIKYKFKVVTDLMNAQLASEMETFYEELYKSKGWKLLNIAKTGGLGGGIVRYTVKMIWEYRKSCSTLNEFITKKPELFRASKYNKIYEDVIEGLVRTQNLPYTEKQIWKAVRSCKTRSEVSDRFPGEYNAMIRFGGREKFLKKLKIKHPKSSISSINKFLTDRNIPVLCVASEYKDAHALMAFRYDGIETPVFTSWKEVKRKVNKGYLNKECEFYKGSDGRILNKNK